MTDDAYDDPVGDLIDQQRPAVEEKRLAVGAATRDGNEYDVSIQKYQEANVDWVISIIVGNQSTREYADSAEQADARFAELVEQYDLREADR